MPFSREYRPNAEEFAGEPAVPGVSVILLRRALFIVRWRPYRGHCRPHPKII